MEYCIAVWNHEVLSQPVWMAYEFDHEGNVKCMIEYFRSGSCQIRSADQEKVSSLHELKFSLDQLDRSSTQVLGFRTTKGDFDAA
jgi:hypothetical protein